MRKNVLLSSRNEYNIIYIRDSLEYKYSLLFYYIIFNLVYIGLGIQNILLNFFFS